MEVRYRCNAEDYVEAQQAYYKKTKASRIYLAMAAILVLAALYMVSFVDIFMAVPLVILAALWTLPRFLLPWKARRDFQNHPNIGRESLLRGDQESLSISSDVTQFSAKWSAYTAFLESANVFMVFTGARTFFIVPKRAFVPFELDEFRKLLLAHLRPR